MNGLYDGLGGQHAALLGGVGPLDLGHVHEPGAAANQAASRKCEFGNTLEAAFVQGPGSICNSVATFKYWSD